jgi:hypothetical protein
LRGKLFGVAQPGIGIGMTKRLDQLVEPQKPLTRSGEPMGSPATLFIW